MKLAGGQQMSAFIEHVELWEAAAIASLAAVFIMIAGVTVLIQRGSSGGPLYVGAPRRMVRRALALWALAAVIAGGSYLQMHVRTSDYLPGPTNSFRLPGTR